MKRTSNKPTLKDNILGFLAGLFLIAVVYGIIWFVHGFFTGNQIVVNICTAFTFFWVVSSILNRLSLKNNTGYRFNGIGYVRNKEKD